MACDTLEMARKLLRTIRELQSWCLLKNAPQNIGLECVAKELTLPQMSTLVVIGEYGEMSIKELAEASNVSPPSASAMVDRLVDIGVVNRVPSRVDRREVRISLSSEGERAVAAMQEQLLQAIVEVLDRLGPELSEQWCALYERIHEILDALKRNRSEMRQTARQRSGVA